MMRESAWLPRLKCIFMRGNHLSLIKVLMIAMARKARFGKPSWIEQEIAGCHIRNLCSRRRYLRSVTGKSMVACQVSTGTPRSSDFIRSSLFVHGRNGDILYKAVVLSIALQPCSSRAMRRKGCLVHGSEPPGIFVCVVVKGPQQYRTGCWFV